MIGSPLTVTLPRIKGIRWRYCSRWDEQPAARLGKSLLRLGISRPDDWSGNAVEFVERGLQRFCQVHGSSAAPMWDGNLRIIDFMFDLGERERAEAEAETAASATCLYLIGEYNSGLSIPIGPTWSYLEREHELLPAAFYRVLVDNLWKWMRVYEYDDALRHAELWMDGRDEEELNDSIYPKVQQNIPASLRDSSKVSHKKAVRLLRSVEPKLRRQAARNLVRHVLDMEASGRGHEHPWPGKLAEQVPGLEEYLSDADGCGPGCVITWHEGDEISACCDEELSTLGQNGPIEPSLMLMMKLDSSALGPDEEVRRVFNFVKAMMRSLASAAKVVEIVQDINDEYLREHRVKSGIPAVARPAGVRDE